MNASQRDDLPPDPSAQKRPGHEPHQPTAEPPPSVEESVYEDASYVGKDGPNAADPPTAKRKLRREAEADQQRRAPTDNEKPE